MAIWRCRRRCGMISILLDLAPKARASPRSSSCWSAGPWRASPRTRSRCSRKGPASTPGRPGALLDAALRGSDDQRDLREALEGERVFGFSRLAPVDRGESPIRALKEDRADKANGLRHVRVVARPSARVPGRPAAAWTSWRTALRLVDLPAREALPAAEALREEYRARPPERRSPGLFATLPCHMRSGTACATRPSSASRASASRSSICGKRPARGPNRSTP